jgi:hypothetical protein
MPRNSSGVYTLPTGNPVVTGTTITSTWANTTMADVGSELTNSLDRSGRGGMFAAFKLFDGTSSAPGLSFANEPATGLARLGTGVISVVAASTVVGTLDANGFNGGVGGTTPGAGAFTTLAASGNATVGGTFGATGNATFGGTLGLAGLFTGTAATLSSASASTLLLSGLSQNATGVRSISHAVLSDPGDTRRADISFGNTAGSSSSSGYISFATANYGVGYSERWRINSFGVLVAKQGSFQSNDGLGIINLGTQNGATLGMYDDGANYYGFGVNSGLNIMAATGSVGVNLGFYTRSSATFTPIASATTTGMNCFAFNVTSGRELKNIIGPMATADAFHRVMAMKPRLYTLKNDVDQRIRGGFILDETDEAIQDGHGHIDLYALIADVVATQQYIVNKLGSRLV